MGLARKRWPTTITMKIINHLVVWSEKGKSRNCRRLGWGVRNQVWHLAIFEGAERSASGRPSFPLPVVGVYAVCVVVVEVRIVPSQMQASCLHGDIQRSPRAELFFFLLMHSKKPPKVMCLLFLVIWGQPYFLWVFPHTCDLFSLMYSFISLSVSSAFVSPALHEFVSVKRCPSSSLSRTSLPLTVETQ